MPYEHDFLMLHTRLPITFPTSLCVISKHNLRTRANLPPSIVPLPLNVRLLESITTTTIRLHKDPVAQVTIGEAVRVQWLLQSLVLPLGHIIHLFTALQLIPVIMRPLPILEIGPQLQISTHPFLRLLPPNKQGQFITQAIHPFLLQCALPHQSHASRSHQHMMAIIHNLKADIQIKPLKCPFLPTDQKINELL